MLMREYSDSTKKMMLLTITIAIIVASLMIGIAIGRKRAIINQETRGTVIIEYIDYEDMPTYNGIPITSETTIVIEETTCKE